MMWNMTSTRFPCRRPSRSSAKSRRHTPPAAALPASLANTFKLHSLAGANHVIYLDFDGHTTSGTSWNSSYNGGSSFVSPAYDRDGNPYSFSDAELTEIQRIWQRVAEDFRPFGVNVTTEDPGVEALRKSGTGDTKWGVRAIQTGGSVLALRQRRLRRRRHRLHRQLYLEHRHARLQLQQR